MLHTFIGNLGHLFIILSFVSALVSTYAYIKVSRTDLGASEWLSFARSSFYIHSFAVIGIVVSLFYIIHQHYFEYHYAWSHSSLHLPTHYMISCFWEGQEGSFLLWIFWQAIIGVILTRTNKMWEGPLMTSFALVQTFLTSMILGVVIFNMKIGSSPFILLRDVLDAPIFDTNPDFIPEDGTGLNPLLQNYWMVIHPPTLFLGFALTLVPFSYCIGGLWSTNYSSWIKPALPWTLIAALILGVGIIMGAYWAYETLSFGGYWNWDPVENAVYVPWLILVASYHTMSSYQKNKSGLKTTIILAIASFLLILYSTFLTRSGVLGEASVHSFTDLGLSGQLLIYLFTFSIISILFLVKTWKNIPSSEKEASIYSSEFWIFIGSLTFLLMSFQVLLPTSIPALNKFIELFGIPSNMAPPADQVVFYSRFQLLFGITILIISGTAQHFWWNKLDQNTYKNAIKVPVFAAVTNMVLFLLFVPFPEYLRQNAQDLVQLQKDFSFFSTAFIKALFYLSLDLTGYLLIIPAAIYCIVSSTLLLIKLSKKNFQLSGGAITHIGIAMMLIGIIFSSGYSTVVSRNNSGLLISREADDAFNKENVVLFINDSRKMNDYELTYKGKRLEVAGAPDYVKLSQLLPTPDPYRVVASEDIVMSEKIIFQKGDTLKTQPENTYYEVEYKKEGKKTFSLYPRAQVNPNMGLLVSPDIKRYFTGDLYTHLSSIPDPNAEVTWGDTVQYVVKPGEQFFINDYVTILDSLTTHQDLSALGIDKQGIGVKAFLKVLGKKEDYIASPIFVVDQETGLVARPPEFINDLGLKITLINIIPDEGKFVFAVNSTERDYIIMKAIEKPLINILWIGTLVFVIGLTIAVRRRYRELKND